MGQRGQRFETGESSRSIRRRVDGDALQELEHVHARDMKPYEREITNSVLAPSIGRPLRHQIEIGSTSSAPKPIPLQANMNHVVTLSTGRPTYIVFGYEDYYLQCTREHYRKKNIGIVIREESELKIMRKENQRKL